MCPPGQRVEKVFSPCVEQEYTVGPAGFRVLCPRKPGAILETGSLHPPLAALRLLPLLGFPAHTLHPQGVCSIRKAAQPLTAALPYRRGEFTTLLTVTPGGHRMCPPGIRWSCLQMEITSCKCRRLQIPASGRSGVRHLPGLAGSSPGISGAAWLPDIRRCPGGRRTAAAAHRASAGQFRK